MIRRKLADLAAWLRWWWYSGGSDRPFRQAFIVAALAWVVLCIAAAIREGAG